MTRASQRRIRRPQLARRSRWIVLPFAIGVILAQLGTAYAASDTFYLKGDGVSVASLSRSAPSAGTLPNYDPGRDESPGLQLTKTRGTYQETDPAKHQIWVTAPGGIELAGPATLTFWSAMSGFHPDKKGHVEAHLLDCTSSGSECTLIASSQLMLATWASGSETWVQRSIDFGTVTHTVPGENSLAVKLMVDNRSGGDMLFAYDTVSYASSLTVHTESPATTTTTQAPPPLPTTTTTTQPPATTQPPTTSQPPLPPTTTAPPLSTTTLPPNPSATTTTTLPPPTDSGHSTTTTTTPPIIGGVTPPTTTTPFPPGPSTSSTAETSADVPTEAPDEPIAIEDIALGPLPVPETGAGEKADALSSHLLDGLELAIPPAVASSLVSPLLLLESLVGAFSETGRSLLMPGMLLVVGLLWVEKRHRARRTPKLEAVEMNQAPS